MVKFESIEELVTAIDVERNANELYEGWLKKTTPTRTRGGDIHANLLPLVMYSFGLAHYTIAILIHFFPDLIPLIPKKWKISEKKAQELASEFVDRIAQFEGIDDVNFRQDAERLKESTKRAILGAAETLGVSLGRIKEILSNKVYNIVSEQWKNVKRDLIDYIVDAELKRFRELKLA